MAKSGTFSGANEFAIVYLKIQNPQKNPTTYQKNAKKWHGLRPQDAQVVALTPFLAALRASSLSSLSRPKVQGPRCQDLAE